MNLRPDARSGIMFCRLHDAIQLSVPTYRTGYWHAKKLYKSLLRFAHMDNACMGK
jgi:hypothetical protein